MSTIRNPVGPQPPGIYWRRRAVVLIGLIAIIVVVLLIVFRPAGGTPTDTKTSPAPTDVRTNTSTNSATGSAKACDPAKIELAAITDKGGYNEGEQPLVSMSITNTGSTACEINAGTDAQEYIISSGSDQIWSSRDCQADPAPTATVLEPGVAKSTTPFGWDRTRSSVDTCAGQRPAVAAGGASYHLTVKLGDVSSAETKQFLLY
jgi:hypothetical protein